MTCRWIQWFITYRVFLFIDTNAKWSYGRTVHFIDMRSFANCSYWKRILFDIWYMGRLPVARWRVPSSAISFFIHVEFFRSMKGFVFFLMLTSSLKQLKLTEQESFLFPQGQIHQNCYWYRTSIIIDKCVLPTRHPATLSLPFNPRKFFHRSGHFG